jgi:hypothetical protein
MEWTILDPYGTPYGGERNNTDTLIKRGGSGYEDTEYADYCSYGDELLGIAWFGRNNVGGVA